MTIEISRSDSLRAIWVTVSHAITPVELKAVYDIYVTDHPLPNCIFDIRHGSMAEIPTSQLFVHTAKHLDSIKAMRSGGHTAMLVNNADAELYLKAYSDMSEILTEKQVRYTVHKDLDQAIKAVETTTGLRYANDQSPISGDTL